MGLMQIGLKYAFFYLGLAFVPAALGAMLSGAGPVVVALVARSVSREESISRKMWGAIVLGGMGVTVLTLGRQRIGALNDYAPVGIALIILSNVVSALGDLAVSKDRKGLPPMLIASASLIVGGLGLLAVGIPTEGWRSPVGEPLEFYASLVALCCISSIGFAIWFTLLKRPFVRVVTLNFWKFLIPLLGSVFAWIVMPGECPTVVALLGMLLIVGALMLLSRDARQSQ
jgi:putative permease